MLFFASFPDKIFFFLSRSFEVILISGAAQGDGGNAETK